MTERSPLDPCSGDPDDVQGSSVDYKAVIVRAPVRILHVTPYSADAWAYGGIPRLLDSLTRGLARRGHDVTVCTTDACDALERLPADAPGRGRLHAWPATHTPA